MEMIDIVEKLIGPVTPTGMHDTDIHRLKNLKEMTDLVGQLLFKISSVSNSAGSHESSVAALGLHARSFLLEVQQIDV